MEHGLRYGHLAVVSVRAVGHSFDEDGHAVHLGGRGQAVPRPPPHTGRVGDVAGFVELSAVRDGACAGAAVHGLCAAEQLASVVVVRLRGGA